MKGNFKNGILIGCSLILIAIMIAIFLENDIAFLFAGIGTIVIGITFLAYINTNKDDK